MDAVQELENQIMEMRKLKTSLENTLYNTNWKNDNDADPIIRKLDSVNEQLEKLRKQKKKHTLKNYTGEVLQSLGGGVHFSSTSLKGIL